ETAVPHHDQHVVQPAWAGRDDAAPGHLPGIARRWPPEREGAYRRMDAVGADDQIIVRTRTVTEVDNDPLPVLAQPHGADPEPGGHRGGARKQPLLQLGAFNADAGPHITPQLFVVGVAEELTPGVAECRAV